MLEKESSPEESLSEKKSYREAPVYIILFIFLSYTAVSVFHIFNMNIKEKDLKSQINALNAQLQEEIAAGYLKDFNSESYDLEIVVMNHSRGFIPLDLYGELSDNPGEIQNLLNAFEDYNKVSITLWWPETRYSPRPRTNGIWIQFKPWPIDYQ